MRLIAGNSVQIRNLSSTIALSGAMFVGLCGNAFADGREVLEQFFELNRFGSAEATLTVADGDIGESGDYYQYQNVTFGYFNEVEIKFAEILISKDAAFGDESTIPESILNGVTVDVGNVYGERQGGVGRGVHEGRRAAAGRSAFGDGSAQRS